MAHSKKVLILYASAGHGHEKAAKALLEAYEHLYPEAQVRAVDALAHILPGVGPFYRQVYYLQVKHAPFLWGGFYFGLDHAPVYALVRHLRRFVNGLLGSPLHRFIERENADTIITTHFLSTEVAGSLKRRGRIRSRIYTVVTDYLPHWIWTDGAVDGYFVATDETKRELACRDVPENRIHVHGIPVLRKFLTKHDSHEMDLKLGIREKLFTVLVTSGGAGIGDTQAIVKGILSLKKPVQVLVVCGTNKALFMALSGMAQENRLLKVFGFVSNMDELMEASDLVVGKGGGLTVTESFVKGKPVILFRSVPGQESRNADFVARHAAGFATDSIEEVVRIVSRLHDEPGQIQALRDEVRLIAKPNAAFEIVKYVEEEGK